MIKPDDLNPKACLSVVFDDGRTKWQEDDVEASSIKDWSIVLCYAITGRYC